MSKSSRSWELAPLVAGFVACAACCAIPLLAAAGIGSGALLRLADVAEPLGLGLLVVGAGVAVFSAVRKRNATAGCGQASCAADGACGCAPPGAKG